MKQRVTRIDWNRDGREGRRGSGIGVLLAGALLATQASAWGAERVSFDALWARIRGHAPQLAAAATETRAARIGAERASRHWAPRLMAEGRAFRTNDPGTILFSLLGQRSVSAFDFTPALLNEPAAQGYLRGALIADLPLYEGGAPSAGARAADRAAEARAQGERASLQSVYAESAASYGSLLALEEQREELESIRSEVAGLLRRYGVGTKSNPLGYSGYLGLKSLMNRVEAILEGSQGQGNSLRASLSESAGGLPAGWRPAETRSSEFIRASLLPAQGLGTEPMSSLPEGPAHVRAAFRGAEAAETAAEAELARLLPRAGIFGQGNLLSGERDTAGSYSFGAYLQWELFSPTSYGSTRQARLEAASARSRAEAELERSRAEAVGAAALSASIERNLERLEDSRRLLAEQTATARNLYLNGSINALQLVEVIARRTDLAVDRTQALLQLAQVRAKLAVHSDLEVRP